MERIPSDGEAARIMSLSALLAPPATEEVADAPLVDIPDPVEQLQLETARVLEAAREQGLREGRAQAEAELAHARDEARREVKAAHADEQARLKTVHMEAARLLHMLEALPAERERAIEEMVVEVAHVAVLRLLGACAADVLLVRTLCQQALTEMTQRPVVLRVHPMDADAVATLADGTEVRIEADARLQSGQCRLQTRRGDYDTSLEERLHALTQAFLGGLRETRATP